MLIAICQGKLSVSPWDLLRSRYSHAVVLPCVALCCLVLPFVSHSKEAQE